ncbi:DUF5086 domain-containing protein [Rhizobium lentis]|uniref:DUF5086 domain-containing protein n=1 Tax=Rhizobium lentis TaxID=1138194 RepID=UPI002180CA00|nr:DUF5086 domain-containing protein [Rhizobium lentis]
MSSSRRQRWNGAARGTRPTYFYKDIEFRIAYQNWRTRPHAQREAGVCRTTILECVGVVGKSD